MYPIGPPLGHFGLLFPALPQTPSPTETTRSSMRKNKRAGWFATEFADDKPMAIDAHQQLAHNAPRRAAFDQRPHPPYIAQSGP